MAEEKKVEIEMGSVGTERYNQIKEYDQFAAITELERSNDSDLVEEAKELGEKQLQSPLFLGFNERLANVSYRARLLAKNPKTTGVALLAAAVLTAVMTYIIELHSAFLQNLIQNAIQNVIQNFALPAFFVGIAIPVLLGMFILFSFIGLAIKKLMREKQVEIRATLDTGEELEAVQLKVVSEERVHLKEGAVKGAVISDQLANVELEQESYPAEEDPEAKMLGEEEPPPAGPAAVKAAGEAAEKAVDKALSIEDLAEEITEIAETVDLDLALEEAENARSSLREVYEAAETAVSYALVAELEERVKADTLLYLTYGIRIAFVARSYPGYACYQS